MAVVESEDVGQPLLVHSLTATVQAAENDSLVLTAVAAEVNDVRAIPEQQSLKIAGPCRWVVKEFEALAVWTFVQSLEDLSRLFVDENSARVPGVGG